MGEAYFWESQLLYFKKTAILYSAKDLFKLQDKIDLFRRYISIFEDLHWDQSTCGLIENEYSKYLEET